MTDTTTPMSSTERTRTDASPSTITKRTRYAQLTGFRRDILWSLARLEGDEPTLHKQPHGLAIKQALEDLYAEEINHGRLYPNLDQLVDAGFVEKSDLDKRTNAYELTDRAREILRSVHDGRTEVFDDG